VAEYLAHSRSKSGRIDTVADHLKSVAETAAKFASAFGAADEAYFAGLLHDLGTYGDLFQKHLCVRNRSLRPGVRAQRRLRRLDRATTYAGRNLAAGAINKPLHTKHLAAVGSCSKKTLDNTDTLG